MKRVFQMFFAVVLLTGMSAVLGGEPSLRMSIPQDGTSVDCDGFFIVAHAENLVPQDLKKFDLIELKSEVWVTEIYHDDEDKVYWAKVNPSIVENSEPEQIEAVKPDAKDMTVKIFTPRKLPIVTYFICSEELPDQIEIRVLFERKIDQGDWLELSPVSLTVSPE